MSPKRMCLSEKKKEDENGAAENNEKAMWEGLNPEILALIFTRIPAEQRIEVLSLVCKSWSQCLCGPYCWADIDIEQWCRKTNRTVFKIDSAVCKLVRRTKGTVRRLSAFKLGDRGFAFIANWFVPYNYLKNLFFHFFYISYLDSSDCLMLFKII